MFTEGQRVGRAIGFTESMGDSEHVFSQAYAGQRDLPSFGSTPSGFPDGQELAGGCQHFTELADNGADCAVFIIVPIPVAFSQSGFDAFPISLLGNMVGAQRFG